MRRSTAQMLMFSLGLSPKHKGFHYLSRALCAAAGGRSVEEAIRATEGEAAQQADRCMRYAIRYAWDGDEGRIKELFPYYRFPPTPVELIHALIWRLEDEAEPRAAGRA